MKPFPLLSLVDAGYHAANDPRPPRERVIRASSLGDQPRKLVLSALFDDAREKPTGRALRTFEVGKQRHDALRAALASQLGEKDRVPVRQADEEELEEPMRTPGWRVVGHPDGVLATPVVVNGDAVAAPALLEIKTINAFGWTRVLSGEIDPKYLVQSGWYARAARTKARIFLFEKKDTQHLHAAALPAREPLLDQALEWAEEAAFAAEARPELDDFIAKSEPCSGPDYGWQTSRTGPPKLGWRCSYCPFASTCFPTMVRTVVSGKPVCVDEKNAPADAYVVGMGGKVVPRGSWRLGADLDVD